MADGQIESPDRAISARRQAFMIWRRAAPVLPGMRAALHAAERSGLRFFLIGRLALLTALGAWLLASVPASRVLPELGLLACFAGLGLAPFVLSARFGRFPLWAGLFAVFDTSLLTSVILAPQLIAPSFSLAAWPVQLRLRWPGVLYLFLYVAASALGYSPGLVLCSGFAAAAAWSVGAWLIARMPDSIVTGTRVTDTPGLTPQDQVSLYLNPHYVSIFAWQNQVVLLLFTAAVLALAVWRARTLMHRQVAAEQARTSLARYVSPSVVDRLVMLEEPFGRVRRQPAAVLFVDIVGFTSIAERLPPERSIELLRSFHQRMARSVFAHGGTIDDYIGDEVMAVFGTPVSDPSDPARALACGLAMLGELRRWNAKRADRGAFPLAIGIGIHMGDVVLGNTGDERRLKFTVVGDTVNVASRLERLTRDLSAALVVSDDLLMAARRAGAPAAQIERFVDRSSLPLRGRERELAVWCLRMEKEHRAGAQR